MRPQTGGVQCVLAVVSGLYEPCSKGIKYDFWVYAKTDSFIYKSTVFSLGLQVVATDEQHHSILWRVRVLTIPILAAMFPFASLGISRDNPRTPVRARPAQMQEPAPSIGKCTHYNHIPQHGESVLIKLL